MKLYQSKAIILTGAESFEKMKGKDQVKLQCFQCQEIFHKSKKIVLLVINEYYRINRKGEKQEVTLKHCSRKCSSAARKKIESVSCANCNIKFKKQTREIKRTSNNFCSRSCSASFNNRTKHSGYRRSKLEFWLEEKLKSHYKDLPISFNNTEAINFELDIYIPSLHIAFEINGIFHYKPIHGIDKLKKTKSNDMRKIALCKKNNIKLYRINSSKMKNFSKRKAVEYLEYVQRRVDLEL